MIIRLITIKKEKKRKNEKSTVSVDRHRCFKEEHSTIFALNLLELRHAPVTFATLKAERAINGFFHFTFIFLPGLPARNKRKRLITRSVCLYENVTIII